MLILKEKNILRLHSYVLHVKVFLSANRYPVSTKPIIPSFQYSNIPSWPEANWGEALASVERRSQ